MTAWAGVDGKALGIPRQIDEVLGRSLPGVIRTCAGIGEVLEILIQCNQALDLRLRRR